MADENDDLDGDRSDAEDDTIDDMIDDKLIRQLFFSVACKVDMRVDIYIYICYPPPQLSTFFVAFQGTRGNMFPKLGVIFSF